MKVRAGGGGIFQYMCLWQRICSGWWRRGSGYFENATQRKKKLCSLVFSDKKSLTPSRNCNVTLERHIEMAYSDSVSCCGLRKKYDFLKQAYRSIVSCCKQFKKIVKLYIPFFHLLAQMHLIRLLGFRSSLFNSNTPKSAYVFI